MPVVPPVYRPNALFASTAQRSAVRPPIQRSASPSVPNVVQRQIAFEGLRPGKPARKRAIGDLAAEIKKGLSGPTPTKGDIEKALTKIDGEEEPCTVAEASKRVIEALGGAAREVPTPREDVSARAKAERRQPYLELLDHMAGERAKKDAVKGGHLLLAMQDAWKDDDFSYEYMSGDRSGIWKAKWRLGSGPWKESTMFPEGWSSERLRSELTESNVVGRQLELPSGLKIEKKGDTFWAV